MLQLTEQRLLKIFEEYYFTTLLYVFHYSRQLPCIVTSFHLYSSLVSNPLCLVSNI